MRISELSTDRAADVLCEISVFILNIVEDVDVMDTLKAQTDKAETLAGKYALGAQKIGQWVPLLLKKHKADVFGILAALNESTVEKIGAQNIIKTMAQIREAVQDKELVDFFKSCASGGSK